MKNVLFALLIFCTATLLIANESRPMRITGPLTASGHVDFFKAFEERFYPPEIATDDNGFREFIRLFGIAGYEFVARYEFENDGMVRIFVSEEERESYRRQIYEKLGLDPDIPTTMTLPKYPQIVAYEYYMKKGEEPDWNRLNGLFQPWTLEEFPMLADWVNEIDEPLDAIAETIRKPVFFAPRGQCQKAVETGIPRSFMSGITAELQMFRDLARAFLGRAHYRIAQGNIDGAIEDKLTAHRLGRHITLYGNSISYLVGIAIEGMAMGISVGANPEHPLTKQQIRRALEGLDALPPRPPASDALQGMILLDLGQIKDLFILHAQGEEAFAEQWKNWEDIGLKVIIDHPLDWSIVHRQMDEVYVALQEPPPREQFQAMRKAAEKLYREERGFLDIPLDMEAMNQLFSTHRFEVAFSKIFIASMMEGIPSFEEAIRRSKCCENMKRLTLAILLYRFDHGTMPNENWVAQITPYLGENPERYFSCPSNPSETGHTTYALVQFDGDVPSSHETIFLYELNAPVPFEKAVLTVEEVLRPRLFDAASVDENEFSVLAAEHRQNQPHPGGRNTARQSGAVLFMTSSFSSQQLPALLGR